MNYLISIDPGLLNVGFAIFSYTNKKSFLNDYGLITTNPDDTVEKRLFEIKNDIKKILTKYNKINICIIEKIFFVKNVTNGISVSMSKGVILSQLYDYNNKIKILEYSPMKVKKTISGYGMADKLSMRKMLLKIYPNLNNCTQDDVLDAIAIGSTYFLEKKIDIQIN